MGRRKPRDDSGVRRSVRRAGRTGKAPDRESVVSPASRSDPGGGLRRRVAFAGAVAIAALFLALLVLRRDPATSAADLPAFPPWPAGTSGDTVAFEDFVGAEACAECHAPQHEPWSGSTHGRAGGDPASVPLLAGFDGAPIRFSDATVTPRQRGSVFEFAVAQAEREPVQLRVDGVVGGGHMVGGGTQGFVTRHEDGGYRFLPFELARREGVWFCNSSTRADRGWVPITADMALAECGDWPPVRVLGESVRYATCQNCHGSQIEVSPRPGRSQDTRFASLAIDCESCHGPARRHVELAQSGALAAQADIGLQSLAVQATDASLEVCFRCHALKDALRPGWLPGESLQEFYSLKFPLLDAPLFADGRIRTFAYQQGHLFSDCYLNGSMTCVDCHEPHGQGYRDVNGRALPGRFDDGQCTACHASKAAEPERHTRHAPDSEGSRCVSCHMPYLQEPEVGPSLRYVRSDHTIPIPRPAFDAALGVEVACQLCHADQTVQTLEARVRDWWGELKPHPAAVSALTTRDTAAAAAPLDAATLLEVAADTASRHTVARFLALGQVLTGRVTAAAPLDRALLARLRNLAEDPDDDIAAAALAVMHHDPGDRADTRRFMIEALGRLGPREPAVRARWAVLLGFLGDRHRSSGDVVSAIATYLKALEVRPEDPATLLSLGLAYTQTRNLDAAERAYAASLRLEPTNSLALVNLGIARTARGDDEGAARAYRDAIAMAPADPLPHLNLGNVHLRAGDANGAIPLYTRAIALDPSLAPAHFNLARAYIALENLPAARAALRRGLEFDPRNEEARSALTQLEAASDPRAR